MIKFTGNAGDFLKIGVAAAARGDLESVRAILKAKPNWIQRAGSHGRTMLWEACHRGKLEMVKYLVKRKADINACGTHYTPYFVEISCYCIARHKNRTDVADYLQKKGATIDIHTAAFLGDLDLVKRLLKGKSSRLHEGHVQHEMGKKRADGLDFFPAPAAWATPLCYALRGGNLKTIEFLIAKGSKIKKRERKLFIAADGECDRVRLLLENGADPNLLPEVYSDEGGLFELVSSYGVKPPDIAMSDELVYLCRGDRGGDPKKVQRILDLGANVNFQDHKGKTAMHRAAKAGFVDAMKVLLKHKADVNLEDLKGETALFDAVRSTIKNQDNNKKAIRLLLKSGAKKSHKNQKSQTASKVALASKRADAKTIAKMVE